MAFIKIDLDGMLTVVRNLDERAGAVDEERRNIDATSSDNHDPVESVVLATEVASGPFAPGPGALVSSTNLHTCAEGLRGLADELRIRRQEAIDLNSSGITANPGGTATYYLPDPPPDVTDLDAYWASADTVTNVQAYNSRSVATAKAEAAELQEALDNGASSQGRTPEEILEQIEKHQDIPTYGLSFCMEYGVGAMLDAPLDAQADTNYALAEQPEIIAMMTDAFGRIMCATSTLYGESPLSGNVTSPSLPRQYSLVSEIFEAVTEKGHEGRATVLDAYLTAEGTVYGADFLAGLAGMMEKVQEWPDEPEGAQWHGNYGSDDYGDDFLPGHTTDPLAAALHAMGNNPEAASAYLTASGILQPPASPNEPEGDFWAPSSITESRMELLASRDWTPLSLEGLSAAFAGVSANRAPAPGDNADERAAWATGQGILILANQDLPNGEVDENIGVMLGNCGPEVVGIANRAGIIPDSRDQYKMAPAAVGSEYAIAVEDSLARLLWDVSDSSDANYSIVQGTTLYSAARASARAEVADDPLAAIKDTYDSQSSVLDLVSKLSQDRADDGYNGAMAAAGALSAVPGVGVLGAAASTGLTLEGAPKADTTGHNDTSALLGAAYTNAFSSGLINNPPDPATTSWYSVNPDGSVTIALGGEQQVKEFYSWVEAGAGGSYTVVSEFNEIGVDGPSVRWEDADAFKDAYGGDDW